MLGHQLSSWAAIITPNVSSFTGSEASTPSHPLIGTLSGTSAAVPEWLSQQTELSAVAPSPTQPIATYTGVAVHCKPERAFELAAYASIVLNLARDVKGTAWSRYDLVFRQAAAGNHQLPWHRREPDIWLTAAMEASTLPSTRSASLLDQPPAQRSSQICKLWNRGTTSYH